MGFEGTILQAQLADAVKDQIALRSDFQDDGIIGMIVDMIDNLFGIDLSAFFDVVDGILAPVNAVINQVIDIFNGLVVTPINSAIAGVMDWFNGIVGDVAGALTGLTTKASTTDLAALQADVTALEGVVGYCHAYCSGGFSMSAGDMFIPVNVQIGPSVGVVYTSNTVYLASKGLWVADLNINIDLLNVGIVYTNAQIRVYTPGGSLYAQRIMEADTDKRHSLSCHLPFAVPTGGYYVQVWANAGLGRGFKGGSVWNALSVEKRSTEDS